MGGRIGPVQISRVSNKGQVTLAKKVCEAIYVGPGDAVTYEVSEGVVTLRRLEPLDLPFHAAVESTLVEWSSKEDDEAYAQPAPALPLAGVNRKPRADRR